MKPTTPTFLGNWAAASLMLAALVILAACQPAGLTGSTGAGADSAGVAPPVSSARRSQGEDWRGFPVGFTSDGFPYRGDPKAPVVLTVFGSYPSPYVARFVAEQLYEVEESYVRDGQVRLVYRHFPMPQMFQWGLPASQATECAARQGATAFWHYHDELYRRQIWWTRDPNPLARFQELAAELGLDSQAFGACLEGTQDMARVEAEAAAAAAAGIFGVPSLWVNQWLVSGAIDLGTLQDLLDAALAGQPRPAPPTPGGTNSDILGEDRTRPGYTLLGDAYLGNLEAPMGFMLFDDPQSATATGYRQAIVDPLFQDFVESGRIWVLYRHMTEPGDELSQVVGEAMECAGRQEAFWEMRSWLLDNRQAWTNLADPQEAFVIAAGTLGLETSSYQECLASQRLSFKVRQDRTQAFESGLRQAPVLILFSQEEPLTINRNLPYESVAQLVEAKLVGTPGASP